MYFASLTVTKINWPKKEGETLKPTLRHQLADWLRAWEKRTLVNQRHTRGATGRSWRGCTWNVKGTRGCSRGSIQRHWSIGLCNAQHWHTETAKGANTTMLHGSLNTFTGCKLKYLYNQRHTGLLWWLSMHPASCSVWSEWIAAKTILCKRSECKNDLHASMFLFSPCAHTHRHICSHIIHQLRGAGQVLSSGWWQSCSPSFSKDTPARTESK